MGMVTCIRHQGLALHPPSRNDCRRATVAATSYQSKTLPPAIFCARALLTSSEQLGGFYFIRYTLALACALCQTLLYRVISLTVHPRIGVFFILALILSPGNFHASTAYLPSSFSMCTGMLGAAAFMDWTGGLKTAAGIAWFAAGGIIGWPFAMALAGPFLLEEALLAVAALGNLDQFLVAVRRVTRGALAAVGILVSISVLNQPIPV